MTGGETVVLIGACAVITAVIKAAGPVALGGRELPEWFDRIIRLMAPALLAAFVATSVFAEGDELGVGPDTAGVAAAGLVFLRGGNLILGVAVAAAVTAALRASGWG